MLPASYQLPAAIVLLVGGIVACFFGERHKFITFLHSYIAILTCATLFFEQIEHAIYKVWLTVHLKVFHYPVYFLIRDKSTVHSLWVAASSGQIKHITLS